MTGLALGLVMAVVTGGQYSAAQQKYVRTVLPEVTGRNGYEEYVMATAPTVDDAKWQAGLRSPGGGRGQAGYLEGLRSVVAANQRAYQLVVQGNAKDVVYPQVDALNLDLQLPELGEFRNLTYLFPDKAEYEFASGQPTAAYSTLGEGLIFARKVQNAGLYIHTLVGLAMTSVVLSSVDFSVPPDMASCQKLENVCGIVLAQTDFAQQLRAETKLFKRAALTKDDMSRRTLLGLFYESEDEAKGVTDQQLEDLYGQLSGRLDELTTFLASVQGKDEKGLVDAATTLGRRSDSEVLVEKAVGVYQDQSVALLRSEAMVRTWYRLLQLTAMVWEYRWSYGQFPASLDDLKAADKTRDSFTGRNYEYRVEGGKFEVWSAGYGDLGEIHIGGKVNLRSAGRSQEIEPPNLSLLEAVGR